MRITSKSQQGQTLIEFALIIVLLLVFIFGIIEFSILMYDKAIITMASREGARAGVIYRADASGNFGYLPLTQTEIRNAVNNYIQGAGLVTFGTPFNPATDVTVTWSTDGGTTWTTTVPSTHGDGTQLRVDVAFTYTFLTLPRLSSFGNGSVNLLSTTTMRLE